MSAFLVKDKLITNKNLIREMWVNHFETLGTPSNSENFDSNFLAHVTASVEDIFKICSEDPAGALCTPLEYEEVARVCSILKPGISGISLDYEHKRGYSFRWSHSLEPFVSFVSGFLSNTYSA